MPTPFQALLIAATVAGLAIDASPAQAKVETWDHCARAVRAAERSEGIPKGLLTAISLAESGRWNAERRASLAWPWTVMAEGKGQYFPTKQDAIAHVEAVRARGVRNVDVGCMQVNLKYHPDAFANLDEALDPGANAAYAARFLRGLRRELGHWTAAAGRYHSATPELSGPYLAKVVELWGQKARSTGLRPASGSSSTVRATANVPRAQVRRSAAARAGLRQRTLFTSASAVSPRRDARALERFAARRAAQLAAWRETLKRRLHQ